MQDSLWPIRNVTQRNIKANLTVFFIPWICKRSCTNLPFLLKSMLISPVTTRFGHSFLHALKYSSKNAENCLSVTFCCLYTLLNSHLSPLKLPQALILRFCYHWVDAYFATPPRVCVQYYFYTGPLYLPCLHLILTINLVTRHLKLTLWERSSSFVSCIQSISIKPSHKTSLRGLNLCRTLLMLIYATLKQSYS